MKIYSIYIRYQVLLLMIIMNDDNNYGIVQKREPTIKWDNSVNIKEQII